MSSPSTPRVNPLITLMCKQEGIDVPGADAYTTRSPTPLTSQETDWVRKLIHERKNQGTLPYNENITSHAAPEQGPTFPSPVALPLRPLPQQAAWPRLSTRLSPSTRSSSAIRSLPATPSSPATFLSSVPLLSPVPLPQQAAWPPQAPLPQPAPLAQPAANGLTCTECGKLFKSGPTYRQHLGEAHIGTRCFWSNCSAVVGSESELTKHLKAHNDAASQGHPAINLTCNWPGCGKLCTMSESVARHLRRHTVKAKNAQ
ncbi:hypothetical protein F4781DRAFT_443910 [Annulohypoxylon bovei var. microspora]|nr:hypothetical protein F4781DRAFT_443910 [Annulohypoxylon bovei var. microspora]